MTIKTVEKEEIQEIQIDILKQLNKVCEENNIQYFLSGGTMLGAIRHKGFIPWDDDIDVMMTIDNYKRFLEVWKDVGTFKIITPYTDDDYNIYFAKIYDRRTKMVSTNRANSKNIGVNIDIFPLYPLISDEKQQKTYNKEVFKYHRNLMNTNKRYRKIVSGKTKAVKKIFRYPYTAYCCIIGREYWIKKLYDSLEKYVGQDFDGYTKPLTHIKNNAYFPKKWFESAVNANFEGEKYPVPVGYDEYLKQVFGEDYMIERKVPNHNNKFIWIE